MFFIFFTSDVFFMLSCKVYLLEMINAQEKCKVNKQVAGIHLFATSKRNSSSVRGMAIKLIFFVL